MKKESKKGLKIALIIAGGIVLAAALALLSIYVIVPAIKYSSAEKMLNNGEYQKAATAFENLGNYKNSPEMAVASYKKLYGEETYLALKGGKAGDTYSFGKNEKGENLQWIILERKGDKVLIVLKNILCLKQYNKDLNDVSWGTSTLREWLNNDFFATFTKAEQYKIMLSDVKADSNKGFNTKAGEDTQDKVFILSTTELREYMATYAERKAEYNGKAACYWVRTPGANKMIFSFVNDEGGINYFGSQVGNGKIGVRPAMWVDLSAVEQ